MASLQIHIYSKAASIILMFQFLLLHSLNDQEIKSNTSEPSNNSYELRRHYFSFGLDAATIDNLNGGFSLSYVHKLDEHQHHYLGLQFSGFPSKKSNGMNVNYYSYQTKNGEANTDLAIVNFELVHYYFFSPREIASIFITAVILDVPMEVEVGIGKNWLEAH